MRYQREYMKDISPNEQWTSAYGCWVQFMNQCLQPIISNLNYLEFMKQTQNPSKTRISYFVIKR